MRDHHIYHVYVYPPQFMGNKPEPQFKVAIIVFEGDDPDTAAERRLNEIYRWEKGFHYSELLTKYIKTESTTNKSENKMAKKATTSELVKIEETIKLDFPVITDKFNLGGVDISPEIIKEKVDEVMKIKLESDSDKETYAILKSKATELQKLRTATKKFREEKAKPINEFLKNFKAKVEDATKDAVKPGEDHCAAEMKKYEDWEAEQKAAEQRKIDARILERSKQLSDIQGVKNFESGHWTFPYAPEFIIEQSSLESEFGWDDEFSPVKLAFDEHLKAKEQEDAKNAEMVNALINSRKMLLEMMQYTEQNSLYMKNGHVINVDQIRDTPDAQWKELIQSHNTPVTQQESPFSAPQESFGSSGFAAASQTQENAHNPFAQFATPAQQDQVPAQEVVEEAVKGIFTEWSEDVKFVEASLNATTLRVFPSEFAEESGNVDKVVGFKGELGNGLHFIIYQN